MRLDPFDWLVVICIGIAIFSSSETVAALWAIFLILYFIWNVLLDIRRDIYISKGISLAQEKKYVSKP